MTFQPYPFEKLSDLLAPIVPSSDYAPLSLTIGEPQFETPSFIQKALCNAAPQLRFYPKTAGETALREAMVEFVSRRFGVELLPQQLIPTFGTREVLFNFPQFYLYDKTAPKMAYTNPFYQIYEGAAIASRAQVLHINLTKERHFKPEVDEAALASCHLVILNFPNNPTGSTLTLDELGAWVKLALKHDFVLLNDECYSEIYTQNPPPSLLEAALHVGNSDFKNVLVINSISKRSSAPGLRSGFIAGDAQILSAYGRYRTYIGAASPLPLQYAAASAWRDDVHVEEARAVYRANAALAEEILGVTPSEATFYVWLEVDDALAFTCKLYERYNVKVLPGAFLGRECEGVNPGEGFVRIALVESEANTREALLRIRECLNER
ncbi:MAG: succinyldiaminopimelate transaminase [Campylobacterales bacterium]|nr:succinyldiaminopimelate transaminase [Campylobacterales bacterium]